MSKKSRKRNKRLLALAGIITAGTLASRKKASDAQSKISVDSGRGGDSASAEARKNANKKTDYITKKDTSKSDVAPVVKKDTVPYGKMRGAGNTDAEAIAAQKKRAGNAQNIREAQADETSVGNYPTDTFIKPYNKSRTRGGAKDGGRMGLRSGGKAIKKSMGKALRGGGKVMR